MFIHCSRYTSGGDACHGATEGNSSIKINEGKCLLKVMLVLIVIMKKKETFLLKGEIMAAVKVQSVGGAAVKVRRGVHETQVQLVERWFCKQ